MYFLIFSDSHGKRDSITAVLQKQIQKPDAVFFLGDGLSDIDSQVDGIPVISVRGNCDWFPGNHAGVRESEILVFDEKRILLTHGHLHGVKYGFEQLISFAEKEQVDIVLFGHTHIPHIETVRYSVCQKEQEEKMMYLFNPGSIAEGSFGTLTIRDHSVLLSHGHLF